MVFLKLSNCFPPTITMPTFNNLLNDNKSTQETPLNTGYRNVICQLLLLVIYLSSLQMSDAWSIQSESAAVYHITSRKMSLRFDGSSINPLVSSYSGSKQSLWHNQGVFVANGTQTLTTRPPSSTPRRHNWVSRAQRNCSSTSCCPSHRSAAPDRGNQCIVKLASKSVSCWVYPREELGWFFVTTQKLRWATESFASPWRWPARAGSAAPRRTACCSDSVFCPVSRRTKDCCPRSTFYCVSFSFQTFSVVCPTPPRWSLCYPQGRPENSNSLPSLF